MRCIAPFRDAGITDGSLFNFALTDGEAVIVYVTATVWVITAVLAPSRWMPVVPSKRSPLWRV